MALVSMSLAALAHAQTPTLNSPSKPTQQSLPPRVAEAQRFLAQRGAKPGQRFARRPPASATPHPAPQASSATPLGGTNSTATWTALGPSAVQTSTFGLVTGRVSSLALDPSDSTGNRLYVGTTGGGVWEASDANAATASVVFTPLTDALSALGGARDASISIGALGVQPGRTGVILAGTGDPNDLLDSYYGAGILRSTDWGNTWSLIPATVDEEDGLSLIEDFWIHRRGLRRLCVEHAESATRGGRCLAGLGRHPMVDAERVRATAIEGLYYSSDSRCKLASGNHQQIQQRKRCAGSARSDCRHPYGRCGDSSSVERAAGGLLFAAVRYHGYYQSSDGITWARISEQPGTGLTPRFCPTNPGSTGSIDCPIFRGALAVNPTTGDTFAWSVDGNDQDQGLWQDICSLSGTTCTNQSITFAQQWNTAAIEASTLEGPITIPDGRYNLALAIHSRPNRRRWCLPAQMISGNQPARCRKAARGANTTRFHHLHERRGRRVSARTWPGTPPIRWKCLSATIADPCGDQRMQSARRVRCAIQPTPRTSRISMGNSKTPTATPGSPHRGGESLPGHHHALRAHGRPGRKWNRGRESHHGNGKLAPDPFWLRGLSGHRSQGQLQLVCE